MKAIQELSKKNDALETRIKALESKMTGIIKTDQLQGAQGTTITIPTGIRSVLLIVLPLERLTQLL